MKFWLIVFLFGADGSYLDKYEVEFDNKSECQKKLSNLSSRKSWFMIEGHCVSENHYRGIEQDEGSEYD